MEILCIYNQTSTDPYLFSFVETPRKFIIAELSIRKLGSSSVLIIRLFEFTQTDSFEFHKAKQVYCIHHANIQETY